MCKDLVDMRNYNARVIARIVMLWMSLQQMGKYIHRFRTSNNQIAK